MTDAQQQIIAKLNQILAATGGGGGGAPSFAEITGDPSENSNLASALLTKQTESQVNDLIAAAVGTGPNDIVALDGDSKLPAVDGSALTNLPAGAAPYLVYTALLTQSGTDAPVATVLAPNTIGAISWSYNSTGVYDGELTGAFPDDRTFCQITRGQGGAPNSDGIIVTAGKVGSTDDFVRIRAYDNGGTLADMHQIASIEIRVYPAP